MNDHLFSQLIIIPLLISSIAAWGSPPRSSSSSASVLIGGPEEASLSRYQSTVGLKGMVVSDDQQASQWGAQILREGGNAIDAAVATAFMLAVTRPHYASLGGGGFMLFCPKSQEDGPSTCQALDYRERAPNQVSSNTFIHNGKSDIHLSQNGPLASGVPGVTAGLLTALEKFGTMSRQDLLKRPIEYAHHGYVFTIHSERAAQLRWSAMNSSAKQIFGCSSEAKSETGSESDLIPCPPGTIIRQQDLAKVLEAISKYGKAGFYEGKIAKKIVKGLQEAGGKISMEDLSSYQPKFRKPIRGEFEGHAVVSMPPPSSGGEVVLQLLAYSSRAIQAGVFENGFGSANSLHAIIHEMSLAFSDRSRYLGDPDFVPVPLDQLLSSSYLDGRWKTFKLDHAALPESPGDVGDREPQHTTHFSVTDSEGNAVAITTTINDNFGSGFVPPGTGIVMNDEMDDFSLEPGLPNMFNLIGSKANAVAGGKRPLSSMSPTIVRDSKGNAEIVIGAAGGPRIITSVFQSILNRIHFGMSLVDAVAAPRIHQQWTPKEVLAERFGFSSETRLVLEKKGYVIHEVPTLGKIHAIERLPGGRTVGVPDYRGEGAAAAE